MIYEDARRYSFPHGEVTLVTPLCEAATALYKTFQTSVPVRPPTDTGMFWRPRSRSDR